MTLPSLLAWGTDRYRVLASAYLSASVLALARAGVVPSRRCRRRPLPGRRRPPSALPRRERSSYYAIGWDIWDNSEAGNNFDPEELSWRGAAFAGGGNHSAHVELDRLIVPADGSTVLNNQPVGSADHVNGTGTSADLGAGTAGAVGTNVDRGILLPYMVDDSALDPTRGPDDIVDIGIGATAEASPLRHPVVARPAPIRRRRVARRPSSSRPGRHFGQFASLASANPPLRRLYVTSRSSTI